MRVGDKVIHDDFPGSIATVTRFELVKKLVIDKKGREKVETRYNYQAKFDGTSMIFTFFGFDIGQKVHLYRAENVDFGYENGENSGDLSGNLGGFDGEKCGFEVAKYEEKQLSIYDFL